MTCQRCGAAGAELGECPFCHRQLCVECYDADQDYPCRLAPIVQRNEAIRALHMKVPEIAERFALSPRQVWRVLSE
ncbi:hypothetical protein LCGC14_1885530 [marine sediment metagenome]|uniref:Uncharacterized protein n=1 Tax=marine sediment metagenome TaxID=412755 RepID=A0A0F9GPC9_9ZZZZ